MNDESSPSRRRFMAIGSAALGSLIAAAVGIPLVGAFLGPALERVKAKFDRIGPLPALPKDAPAKVPFVSSVRRAYIEDTVQRYVWVVDRKPAIGADETGKQQTWVDTPNGPVTVFSPICPHLGCHYEWVESWPGGQGVEEGKSIFYCPCHHSKYDLDGKVIGGPAPRPLDTLPARIEDGELHVEWEDFQVGIPTKTRLG